MLTILFWNLRRNPIQESVARLSRQMSVDMIILAESEGITPAEMLQALNPIGTADYQRGSVIGCEKLEFYTRFSDEYLLPIEETNRLSVRHLRMLGTTDILVAAMHLPDKRSMSDASQAAEAAIVAQTIRRAEEKVGHQRTILVGDLNMNPFEDGMVGASALHAVMDRQIALKKERTVQGVAYPYFYNPMWSRMGDGSIGPPGTYFYTKAEHVVYFWNTFDQVLIRPDLLERFKDENLMVIDTDGVVPFRKQRGEPDVDISDHLPILLSLDL